MKTSTTFYESSVFPTMTYTASNFSSFYKEDASPTTHGDIGIGWHLPSGMASTIVLDWMKREAMIYGL